MKGKVFDKTILSYVIIAIDLLLYLFPFDSDKYFWPVSAFILLSIPALVILINYTTKNKNNLWLAGILIISIFSFMPSLANAFTNWDDPDYVLNNPFIRNFSFENLKIIFTEPYMGLYQPLSILSLMIDYFSANLNPGHFHLTNVFLHIVNTLLVYRLIEKLFSNNKLAIITAVLFGIHPLHVESVTWITERKDVLFSLFFLLSLIQYISFVKEKRNIRYILAILFFLASLMSKPQGVMLFASLFLIDYLFSRKNNLKILLGEKLPFILIALFFGFLTLYFSAGKTQSVDFFSRIILSGYTFAIYLIKIFFPLGLSAIYPYPQSISVIHYLGFIFSVCVMVFAFISFKKNKNITFGLWFFILNIVLFLQFLPNTYVLMADRYSYIPSIGVFILIALLYNYIETKRAKYIKSLRFVYFIWFILLVILSIARENIWKDSISLWNDTLEKYPDIPEALNNRGYAYFEQNNTKKAMADFNRTLKINPEFSYALVNRGTLFFNEGKDDKALRDYNKALQIFPGHVNALINKGIILRKQPKAQEALSIFNKALNINPYSVEALTSRGTLHSDLKEFDKAISDYNRAIAIDNKNALTYSNRGLVYARQGNSLAAISDFTTCISLDPDFADAYSNRGFTYYKSGSYYQAISDFSQAIIIKPDFATAFMNRGRAYIKINNRNKACYDFNKANSLGLKAAQNEIKKYCLQAK